MLTEKNIQIPIYDFKVEVCVFSDVKEAREKYSEYMEEGFWPVLWNIEDVVSVNL